MHNAFLQSNLLFIGQQCEQHDQWEFSILMCEASGCHQHTLCSLHGKQRGFHVSLIVWMYGWFLTRYTTSVCRYFFHLFLLVYPFLVCGSVFCVVVGFSVVATRVCHWRDKKWAYSIASLQCNESHYVTLSGTCAHALNYVKYVCFSSSCGRKLRKVHHSCDINYEPSFL